MSDAEFDKALLGAAFALAGAGGWSAVSVAEAARSANLDLAKARERFPGRAAILLRFGRLADQTALAQTPAEGPVRDRLFHLLMQRIDVMQAHRAGVLALMGHLPTQPGTAVLLACATRRSMRWLLDAAGVPTSGLRGALRVRGLCGVWLWTMRAWQRDETEDMSATMSALDTALRRAERLAPWLGGATGAAPATAAEADEVPAAEPDTEPPPTEVPAP
ncbi:MAG: TetR family transcriptional regulator [Acetobacteraceae bacterium]